MKISKKIQFRIILVLGLLSLIFMKYWFEIGSNPNAGLWDALENSFVVLTGEYPSRPSSLGGRIVQLILLIFGTLIFGAIVGKISSFFVTKALNKEKFVGNFNDHIIICNWNSKAPAIIKQLQAGFTTAKDIVVISSSDIRDKIFDNDNIYFVHDDPTHHETLQKFNAYHAKSIIILADESSQSPDDKNALIALAVKHLEESLPHDITKTHSFKDIHVVAELTNEERRRHLKDAGVDELVSGKDYSSGIIAQSAIFKGMSKVYQQLLTYSADTNEIYFIKPGNYPVEYIDKSFIELSTLVKTSPSSTTEKPLLLLGIKLRRNNTKPNQKRMLLNPTQDVFDKLKTGDSLIVMAYEFVDRIKSISH
jgi:voltage-gated potassium channel